MKEVKKTQQESRSDTSEACGEIRREGRKEEGRRGKHTLNTPLPRSPVSSRSVSELATLAADPRRGSAGALRRGRGRPLLEGARLAGGGRGIVGRARVGHRRHPRPPHRHHNRQHDYTRDTLITHAARTLHICPPRPLLLSTAPHSLQGAL